MFYSCNIFSDIDKNLYPNLKLNNLKFNQKPIDIDYNSSTEIIGFNKEKFYRLRNPHFFDEELKEKEFKGDPFGNPFKRCREDFETQNFNVIEYDKNNLDESLKQIMEGEKNALYDINKTIIDKKSGDDYSVFPERINKKRSRSANVSESQIILNNRIGINNQNIKSKQENKLIEENNNFEGNKNLFF